jgi:short-subunit dehydrogenase
MKKILLIGGTSQIGQCLINTAKTEIVYPDRKTIDLVDPKSIENFDYSNFDCLILVAGAGMSNGQLPNFNTMDQEYIKNTIDVNCAGSTLLLQQYLKENTEGYVVTIGSTAVYRTQTPNVVYTASKVYVDRMIDILENIYKETRFIRINPAKVSNRFLQDESYITPQQVADGVWYCIENNIKKLDITYKK